MKTRLNFKNELKKLPGFSDSLYENDWRWKLLEELYEKNWLQSTSTNYGKIPKIIHQVWVGGTLFPERYKWWAESWKKFNPDYEYKLWMDEDVAKLDVPNKTLYNAVHSGAKSDILRYYLLDKFGGIYIDTDFECFRSFDDLSNLEFYGGIAYPHDNWKRVELYTCLMGCIPGHLFIKKLLNEVTTLTIDEFKKKGVFDTLTSWYFTRIFFENIKKYEKGIVMTPPDIFYPFPNNKEHWKDTARKYVKPYSYAVHHWEVSWASSGKEVDWIQGEKFMQMADFVYAPRNRASDDWAKWPSTFDPANLKPVSFVYTTIMYLGILLRIVKHLPYKFVILAHNADQHIDEEYIGTYNNAKCTAKEPYIIPENVIKLYAPNLNAVHPKLDILPVGLENSMWPGNKRNIMLNLRKQNLPKTGFIYMNFAFNTNPEERHKVYDMFCNKTWVTVGKYLGGRDKCDVYYREIATHKFIFNPMGNCYDNHRMWEAWYLGCIPVSKRSICISYFEDLPHVIVNDWEEVTEKFLNKEYERILGQHWNIEKLLFSYWRNKINAIQ